MAFIVASVLPSDDNEDNLLATTMVDDDDGVATKMAGRPNPRFSRFARRE
jgi:hypothetical protein